MTQPDMSARCPLGTGHVRALCGRGRGASGRWGTGAEMGGRGGARPRRGGRGDGTAWGAARHGRRPSRAAAMGAGEQRGAGPGCAGAGRACIGRGRGVATVGRGAGSVASGARAAAVAAVTERGREGKRKRGRGPHRGAVGTGQRCSGRTTGTVRRRGGVRRGGVVEAEDEDGRRGPAASRWGVGVAPGTSAGARGAGRHRAASGSARRRRASAMTTGSGAARPDRGEGGRQGKWGGIGCVG